MEEITGEMDMRKIILNHEPLFDYVSNHTGIKMTKPSDIQRLYYVLETRVSTPKLIDV